MLDVLSERGQESVKQSRRALEIIGRNYVETKQDTASDIDGFFLGAANDIIAAYEIKSRDMSVSDLEESFNNEWLITYEKILKGAAISKALCIPFYGLLYLIPDDLVMVIRISDVNGDVVVPFRVVRSKTQATCNGGTANRINAYISMDSAKIYTAPQQKS